MAINKTSKNRIITVEEDYKLMVGKKIIKIAKQVNIEATKENLTLACNNCINLQSNK